MLFKTLTFAALAATLALSTGHAAKADPYYGYGGGGPVISFGFSVPFYAPPPAYYAPPPPAYYAPPAAYYQPGYPPGPGWGGNHWRHWRHHDDDDDDGGWHHGD